MVSSHTSWITADTFFCSSAGANSVPAAVWFLYETLKDRSLQNRVHNTIHKDRSKSEKGTLIPFDVSKLCSDALLQSMYAETLRLRVAAFVIREAAKDDYSFRGWHIKKSEILSITTRTESLNEEVWNTGSPENPHPLDEFWPDRFIVDPKNPHSGPLLKQRVKKSASASDSDSPYFSMDGTSASWIPYGGGANHCPGRHFAKRQIITATAILLSAYEFELAGQGGINKPDVDMRTFGFGTMPPNRPIPFRVRRRRV